MGLLACIGLVSAALWTIDLENCAQRQRNPLRQQHQQQTSAPSRTRYPKVIWFFPETIAPVAFFILLCLFCFFVAHLLGRILRSRAGEGHVWFLHLGDRWTGGTTKRERRKQEIQLVGWISLTNPEDLSIFFCACFSRFFTYVWCKKIGTKTDLVGHVLLDTTHKSQSALPNNWQIDEKD